MISRFEANSCDISSAPEIAVPAGKHVIRADPALRSALLAFGPAEENLTRLFLDDAICVTTGQQPGLLTGPLYTVYKALSAAALARHLETRLNRPVVPVFWVAADDHDFAEANHCFFPSGASDVVRAVLRTRDPGAKLTPMYREQLGNDIEAVLQQLLAVTRDSEFRPGVMEWLKSHYRTDNDIASSFGAALAELVGRFGVVVFFPTRADAKRLTAPWIVDALEQARELDRVLKVHAEDLMSRGKPAPISTGDSASTVLIEASLGRDRLLIEGDRFRSRRSGEVFSLSELRSVAENEPERLSPNVLLRPVVEAAILPTVVYVAGPGEMAYLPQAGPIYRAFGVKPQIAVARWTGRFIESRTARVLEKYEISVDDLNLPEGQLEARLLHAQMPFEAADALEVLRENIEREYGRLARAAEGLDISLQKRVVAAERGAERDLAGVEGRIMSYLKHLNEIAIRQLAAARTSLFPLGKLQERVYNVAPFLVRYGDSFLDGVYEQCRDLAETLETTTGGA